MKGFFVAKYRICRRKIADRGLSVDRQQNNNLFSI
jgi:hypothetical protein